MKSDNFIAVFDSGVGGISVLRQLRKLMPGERYIYFGDSANAPYGSRPTSQVRELTLAAAEKLYRDYPVKALVWPATPPPPPRSPISGQNTRTGSLWASSRL